MVAAYAIHFPSFGHFMWVMGLFFGGGVGRFGRKTAQIWEGTPPNLTVATLSTTGTRVAQTLDAGRACQCKRWREKSRVRRLGTEILAKQNCETLVACCLLLARYMGRGAPLCIDFTQGAKFCGHDSAFLSLQVLLQVVPSHQKSDRQGVPKELMEGWV